MTHEQERLCRELVAKALHMKALRDAAAPGVIPFGMARAKDAVCEAAERAAAELAKPFAITPDPNYAPGAAS
jgi:hypothetical protein